MNKVQKKIHDEVIMPALNRLSGNIIGTLRDFDNEMQSGTVEYSTGANSPVQLAHNVPLMGIGGIKQSSPTPGDPVLIGFIGNTHRYPFMYGRMDMRHAVYTRNGLESHFRSGSHVSDFYSIREEESWDAERLL